MAKIKIKDESGDKEFFTIIPNYICNHSAANDQALYLQMKKYAGDDESGKCFATEQTLMGKLGIGKKAFDKSLKYLLNKKWITFIGKTGGKTRPINTYKVNNIWHLNSEYYKKISVESNISIKKDKFQKEGDISQKQHKISVESNIEQEPNKEELKEDIAGINPAFPLKDKKLDDTPMALQEFIESCKKSPQRHIQIVGGWAEATEPNYTIKGQWNSFIKRNVRPANNLIAFTDEQLQEAFDHLQKDIERIDENTGKKVGFITKFTLETLGKYL